MSTKRQREEILTGSFNSAKNSENSLISPCKER